MLRVQKSWTCWLVVMNTTDSLALSKSSIVAFSSAARSPRAATVRGAAAFSGWKSRLIQGTSRHR